MNAWSWQPDGPPRVTEVDLSLRVSLFSSGWQAALQRRPKVRVSRLNVALPNPATVSIPIGRPKIHIRSFTFPEVENTLFPTPASDEKELSHAAGAATAAGCRPASRPMRLTRIRPPQDIIKLSDRLHYTLQPPLETLLASKSLALPCAPFPYQLAGMAFLYPRHAAILADEMGLGKTMQAIVAIRLLLHAGHLRRVLLVCPKPLVTNWRREFSHWAPEVPITTVEGDRAHRRWQWGLRDVPVKIANYELLLQDRRVLESPETRFDLVVLDEAQRIKNRDGATSRVVCSLAASRRWALTGTPVENSTDDLVGIFEFLAPGYLSPGMTARRLGRATGDYTLRRTKKMVLPDLPPKLYRDAELDLSPEQRARYQSAEQRGVVRLTELGDGLTIQHVFQLVLRLKQICNFDPVTGASTKLERLVADLEEVAASGQKALVFSQWVQTLAQLRERLAPFRPLEYHGGIPTRRRDAVLEHFAGDPARRVLLMTYGAGGVGLNLQFCSYVFLFDRWWNPAVEDQAVNRAHRIGVSGPVTVTRFLVVDSIEERIDQILCRKRELFDAIFSSVATPEHLGLDQSDIFGLFNLTTPQGPLRRAA